MCTRERSHERREPYIDDTLEQPFIEVFSSGDYWEPEEEEGLGWRGFVWGVARDLAPWALFWGVWFCLCFGWFYSTDYVYEHCGPWPHEDKECEARARAEWVERNPCYFCLW